MTEEEGWIKHGLDAIEQVLNQQTIWKKFLEAIHVLKFTFYDQATENYNSLKNNHKATLNLLTDLKKGPTLSVYEPIINYLSY